MESVIERGVAAVFMQFLAGMWWWSTRISPVYRHCVGGIWAGVAHDGADHHCPRDGFFCDPEMDVVGYLMTMPPLKISKAVLSVSLR